MPRGRGGNNYNNDNGGRGGGGSSPHRGRGRGRGGRGRGGGFGNRGGAPQFAGSSVTHPMAEIDFVIQRWDENSNPGSGTHTPNGKGFRGRGRGGFRGRGGPGTPSTSSKPGSGSNTRGRGSGAATPLSNRGQVAQSHPQNSGFTPYESPFARGGGGRKPPPAQSHGKKVTGRETLSDLLYSDRPLLKPVKFVRSIYSATLFETTEEILETVGGDEDEALNEEEEEAHAPTADRVARVFSGASFAPPPPGLFSSSEDEAADANDEDMEEIDFDDLGKLMEQQQEPHPNSSTSTRKSGKETFTGFNFYADAQLSQVVVVGESVAQGPAAEVAQLNPGTEGMVVDVEVVAANDAKEEARAEVTSMVIDTDVSSITAPVPFEANAAPAVSAGLSGSPPQNIAPPSSQVEQFRIVTEPPPASELPDPDSLFFVDTQGSHGSAPTHNTTTPKDAPEGLFFVDTEGSQATSSAAPNPSATAHLRSSNAQSLDRNRGAEPEEQIVYVAPHPKPSTAGTQQKTPVPQISTLPTSLDTLSRSIITGTTITGPVAAASTTTGLASSSSSTIPPLPSTSTSGSPPSDLLRSLRIQNDGRTSPTPSSSARTHVQQALATITSATPRSRKRQVMKERIAAKKNARKARTSGGFGMYGAMASEAALRGRDPRFNERRRDDSDVEWGSDDDDEGVVVEEDVMLFSSTTTQAPVITSRSKKANPEEDNDMSIDPEYTSSSSAMRSFARGLIGPDAGVWTTMGDVEDAGRIRKEDEEMRGGRWNVSDSDSDSDGDDDDDADLDDTVHKAEAELIAEAHDLKESDEDDYEDEDDDGAESSPGFEARLQKLRSHPGQPRSKGKGKMKATNAWTEEDDSDSDEEDDYDDEDLVDELNAILDAHSATLMAKGKQNRAARKNLFNRATQGKFAMDIDDFEDEFGLDAQWDGDDDGLDDSDDDDDDNHMGSSPAPKRSKPPKDLPPSLLAQWERDREKKASRKLLRQQSKLLHALDPLSGPKKGGKKGRKAMLLAAQMEQASPYGKQIGEDILGMRVDSLTAIEAQIRRFLDLHAQESKRNRDIPDEIVLPPMPKATRKQVHELALAFNLKSVSKGKGNGRYTTLIRTTRSGLGINEKKVAKLVRADCQRQGLPIPERLQFSGSGGGGGGGGRGGHGHIKHREGEHVGSAAPKLTETNLGFQMLAKLGWAEGDRIGLASRAGEEGRGLEQPLKAIIKVSKLGLGAK